MSFDFGPFVDPVLLDLIIKIAGILGLVVVICLLIKNQNTMQTGFSSIAHEPILEAQAEELKRHAALLLAELGVCKEEIGVLKRRMEESEDDYEGLVVKYLDLLKRIDVIEEEHAATIRKISLPMSEVHTGHTTRPPTSAPALKPQLSPLPPPVHRALVRSDSTVTKRFDIKKPPLKRED